MRSERKHALVRKSLQRHMRCLMKYRIYDLSCYLERHADRNHMRQHSPCNLPTFRWIQLFCWLTTWKKFFPVQREWVWKGCDRCTSFSECMWCLYRVCTEAQNISRRSERWTTRAPGCPASFQTNSVLCNRWHHTQWTQHKICKSGADFREVSFILQTRSLDSLTKRFKSHC